METIRVVVNGEEREVPAGLSLLDLIQLLKLEPSRVAVELNREIVRREAWTTTAGLTAAAILLYLRFARLTARRQP